MDTKKIRLEVTVTEEDMVNFYVLNQGKFSSKKDFNSKFRSFIEDFGVVNLETLDDQCREMFRNQNYDNEGKTSIEGLVEAKMQARKFLGKS